MPSLFSSLKQSAVKKTPANRLNPSAMMPIAMNRICPFSADELRALTNNKNQNTSATSASRKRSKYVPRRRAATRNSRSTIGKKVINS